MGAKRGPRFNFKMKRSDQKKIKRLLNAGRSPARLLTRCRVLRLSAKGGSVHQIARTLEIAPDTVQRIRTRYKQEGFQAVLTEKPRSGRPRQITEPEIQRIVALACSPPPPGYARWTIRLLAQEAVAQKQVKAIGKTAVGEILSQHQLKPWRKKNVVRSETQ